MTFPGKRGPGEPIHVLENISAQVRHGEFVCLVGPSRLRQINAAQYRRRFLSAGSGEVFVEGEPVNGPGSAAHFYFPGEWRFPWLTVQENIGFGLRDEAEHGRTLSRATSRWSA